MRALSLESFDGPDGLRLVELPAPESDGENVVLDVHAIGINFPDLLATKGQYQHSVPLPFVPGCEVAGVVYSAPEGCGWTPGDRASAFVWDGGYAERVKVPVGNLAPLPADANFETAAAMIVNYHTVHFALAERASVRSGETLLVLGAAGGIGTAAIQVGKGLGARVIAGVADDDQRTIAEAAGAEDVLVLIEDFGAEIREMTAGRGVDVVLDPLGDWFFTEATRALAPAGRILVIGFVAGEIPTLKVNRLLLRNISAVGVGWGAFLGVDPELVSRAAAALNGMYSTGDVRPHIGARFEFAEIPSALRQLGRHEIAGKAIARVK